VRAGQAEAAATGRIGSRSLVVAIAVAMAWGCVWGVLVARWYGRPPAEGVRLGLALFCPGILMAIRPRRHSAIDAERVAR
jgi:hypothetical protein